MTILAPTRILAEPLAYLNMKKKSEETRQEVEAVLKKNAIYSR